MGTNNRGLEGTNIIYYATVQVHEYRIGTVCAFMAWNYVTTVHALASYRAPSILQNYVDYLELPVYCKDAENLYCSSTSAKIGFFKLAETI